MSYYTSRKTKHDNNILSTLKRFGLETMEYHEYGVKRSRKGNTGPILYNLHSHDSTDRSNYARNWKRHRRRQYK